MRAKDRKVCVLKGGLTENRLVVAKGEGVGGGVAWEVGISSCKLLYTE